MKKNIFLILFPLLNTFNLFSQVENFKINNPNQKQRIGTLSSKNISNQSKDFLAYLKQHLNCTEDDDFRRCWYGKAYQRRLFSCW